MWLEFAVASLVSLLILFLPGIIMNLASKIKGALALAISPVLSIAIIEIVVITAGLFAIPLNGYAVVMLSVILAMVFAIPFVIRNRRKELPQLRLCASMELVVLILVLSFSLIISIFYFVRPLDGPGSFSQGPDNTWHLSLIRSFMDYKIYSPLSASLYSSDASLATYPVNAVPQFYPAAWHCIAALTASIANTNVTIAVNATLFVLLATVFPLSAIAFCDSVFKTSDKKYWICLAIIALGFTAFPWWFFCFGPLYSNFASMSILLSVASIFIILFDCERTRSIPALVFSFLLGLVSLVLCQTNAVFTLAVLLFPYCIYRIWKYTQNRKVFSESPVIVKLLPCVAFTVFAIILWHVFYNLPFMHYIVTYSWPATASVRQGIINILTASYRTVVSQIPLAFCLLLGIFYTILRRKHLWLTAAYVMACFMCFVATTSDTPFKSLLTGFWYTDSVRLAANAAIIGMPLAALGLYKGALFVSRLLNNCLTNSSTTSKRLILGTALLTFVIANYYPSFTLVDLGEITTGFGDIESQLSYTNSTTANSDRVLTSSEIHFLEEASEIIPDDALVFNCPDDGSTFAYPLYGINIYYRRTGYEAYGTDGDISIALRTNFDNYATDPAVQRAVAESGVKYVLLLDTGTDITDPDGERYYYDHYAARCWEGLYAIDDNTPGFRVVLAEDDMRLYEVIQ